jgi:hypothetical protein
MDDFHFIFFVFGFKTMPIHMNLSPPFWVYFEETNFSEKLIFEFFISNI